MASRRGFLLAGIYGMVAASLPAAFFIMVKPKKPKSAPVVQRPAASAAPRADVDATRAIDLTRPGAWSAEQDVEIDHRHLLLDETGSGRIASSAGAPRSPYAASNVVADEDDELDLILERRRAVGD